jgi:hypothetical protein
MERTGNSFNVTQFEVLSEADAKAIWLESSGLKADDMDGFEQFKPIDELRDIQLPLKVETDASD